MNYPKVQAAIDELFSKMLEKYGEPVLEVLLERAVVAEKEPVEPVEVKEVDKVGD